MKDEMIRMFELDFPFLAKDAVEYREDGPFMLIAKLNDGTSVLYDDTNRMARRLPLSSREMTEKQCAYEFSRRLILMMNVKHINQQTLSAMTGIPQSTISKYITGKASPNFYKIDKIAKALCCSVDAFRYVD